MPASIDKFSATAAGTNSGATATKAAVDGVTYVVTNISGHVDADSIVTIESPATTVLWESKVDVSLEGFSFNFSPTIPCPRGGAAVGKLSASSADCQVTVSGDIK
jgi:hypothetical protein